MSEKPSKRLSLMNESSTIKMAKLSRELISKGINIINLSLGEPDFDTPIHIREAAKKAIDAGYSHYPPVAGYLDLRQAIVEKFKRDNGLHYAPENIVVSNGAKQSIINVMYALLDEGDEIIIPTPYWVSYPEMAKLTGATIKYIQTGVENNFKITPAQLKNALNEKSKAFIFSSPSNPTGSMYSKDELAQLVEVFKEYPDVFIISDEIYELINFECAHASIASFSDVFDRTIVINGVSKAFAMTGWRIGYMAAPLWIAKACDKIQSQFTSAACSIAQRATIAALNDGYEPTMKMKEAFLERRNLCFEILSKESRLKLNLPDGAFYLFPDVSAFFNTSDGETKIQTADDLSMYLLEKARVSTVSGSGFGSSNCLRLSFAASKESLILACNQILEALQNLK